MPDLGTSLFDSEPLTLTRCPTTLKSLPYPCNSTESTYPCTAKTLDFDNDSSCEFNTRPELQIDPEITEISGSRTGVLKIRFTRMKSSAIDGFKRGVGANSLEDYVNDWKERKIAAGVPETRCLFHFLEGSQRMAECRACSHYIYPGDEISCSVRGCQGIYHLKCAKDELRCFTFKKFKCPQHVCYVCKNKFFWRCVICEMASHDKCAAWPERVIHLSEKPGWAVCWRHSTDWRLEKVNLLFSS